MTIPLHTAPLPMRRKDPPVAPALQGRVADAGEAAFEVSSFPDSLPSAGAGRTPGVPVVPPARQEPGSTAAAARTPEQLAEQAALTALVARCTAGDQGAWQQLVSLQHRRVYGICYRFLGDGTEAEDVTQDVFLKMFRNLRTFDATKGSFQTWLTTLTRNLLVDNYRRTRLERATDSLDEPLGGTEDDGPTMLERLPDTRRNQEQHVAGLELKARIQAALGRVSPELREAVILRDLEDMDYREIAAVLGIPEGTVKSRISRGRAELARLLGRTGERVS